jgi:iron complex transport system ATP-binding protein
MMTASSLSLNFSAVDYVAPSRRGAYPIVRDINLQFATGQFNALIGPNGAGKTTILRLACGLLSPTQGKVAVPGGRFDERSWRSRHLAYLPQFQSVAWPLSVREVAALGLYSYAEMTRAEIQVRVDAALQRCGVADLHDRLITELSGGERARVMLARILVSDAPFLLLDEPVQSLDPAWAIGLMTILAQEAAAGRGIICVMHDLNLVRHYCDRVALIGGGALHGFGEPVQIMRSDTLQSVFATPFQERDDFILPQLDPIVF